MTRRLAPAAGRGGHIGPAKAPASLWSPMSLAWHPPAAVAVGTYARLLGLNALFTGVLVLYLVRDAQDEDEDEEACA